MATYFKSLLVILLVTPNWCIAQSIEQKPDGSATTEFSALDERIAIERQTRFQKYVLTPHKPNYVLPVSYNSKPNQASFDPNNDGKMSRTELKFQLSIKLPVVENIFGEEGTLYFAYTNLSFWQAYNSAASEPFRETNHEPEVFLGFPINDMKLLGFRSRLIFIGMSHKSNGRSGSQSRGWNRIYADFIFQRDNLYLSIKPWVRMHGEDDDIDNPDIEDYMGHGEIRWAYASGKHTVAFMMRNNLQSDNKGAIELDWSFPMSRRSKWFLQYFNGYGESLIDYNVSVNRIGIGIAFTDWL